MLKTGDFRSRSIMKKLLSKIDHAPAAGHSQSSCIGKSWSLPKHNVTVEEVIAEGGFGIVFLAKQGSQKFALKRLIVNSEHDLAVATREIQIMVSIDLLSLWLNCEVYNDFLSFHRLPLEITPISLVALILSSHRWEVV